MINQPVFGRRPLSMHRMTHYYHGRPNVVFLDRFDTLVARRRRRRPD